MVISMTNLPRRIPIVYFIGWWLYVLGSVFAAATIIAALGRYSFTLQDYVYMLLLILLLFVPGVYMIMYPFRSMVKSYNSCLGEIKSLSSRISEYIKKEANRLHIDVGLLFREMFIVGAIPVEEEVNGKRIKAIRFMLFKQTEFAMMVRAKKVKIESKWGDSLESALTKLQNRKAMGAGIPTILLIFLLLPILLSPLELYAYIGLLLLNTFLLIPIAFYAATKKQEDLIRDFYKFMTISQYVATTNAIDFPTKKYRIRKLGAILLFLSVITGGLLLPIMLGAQVWRWNRATRTVREISSFFS